MVSKREASAGSIPPSSALDAEDLKRRKDALVSALFSLSKAAGEASSATIDLINLLQGAGHDTTALSNAFRGIPAAVIPDIPALPALHASPVPAKKPAAKKQPLPQTQTEVSLEELSNPALSSEEPDAQGAGLAKPKEKRGRRPRLPGAPKRPLPMQLVWMNEQRRLVKSEREAKGEEPLKRDEMSELLAGMWNDLSPDVRAEHEQSQKEKMDKYNEEVRKFKKLQDGEATPEATPVSEPKEIAPVTKEKPPKESTKGQENSEKSPSKRKKNREDKEKRHKKA